jgi:hypothetical protein
MAQNAGINAIAGAALCWLALFSPGIILIFGVLPYWGLFRKFQVYRRRERLQGREAWQEREPCCASGIAGEGLMAAERPPHGAAMRKDCAGRVGLQGRRPLA